MSRLRDENRRLKAENERLRREWDNALDGWKESIRTNTRHGKEWHALATDQADRWAAASSEVVDQARAYAWAGQALVAVLAPILDAYDDPEITDVTCTVEDLDMRGVLDAARIVLAAQS